jgi:hypothetical protein
MEYKVSYIPEHIIHVPKNTYEWHVPMLQFMDISSWGHIDPSRPEKFKIERVLLIVGEDGIRKGYSEYLHMWIVADS